MKLLLRRTFLPLFALFTLLIGGLAPAAEAQSRGEYVIVSGGPSLHKWENYRRPGEQHDRWWGNFIRPARIRIQQIQQQDPSASITWMVYRRSFETRSAEDKRSLTELVNSVRDKFHVHLVWFESGNDIITYLNNGQNRGRMPVCDFEYFGHSNKFCFMFDYSNAVYGASIAWLHEKELSRLRGSDFAPNAFCKSWGCHTGESMSRAWRKATGIAMIGADGKTDYSNPVEVELSPGGHWTKG